MLGLELREVSKTFGGMRAVDRVSLALPQGQFTCFLGPSGCGKTTLMRIVAGLERPNAGTVLLNGKDITDLPAHRRQFGMIFQSLALFPHLSVEENIAYSMRLRGFDRRQRTSRVAELLELIQLPDIGKRNIGQLSGGQRQRVAIARALAQEPSVFLLDEPLSALDAKLREEMQVELRLLQQRLKITTILVTHDQREAMTMADRIVVMAKGRVQQVGAPLEIYRNPANRFVADFIGLSNLLDAEMMAPDMVSFANRPIRVTPPREAPVAGARVTLSIRPEDIRIGPGDDGPGGNELGNSLPARVTFVRDVGANIEARLDCAGRSVVAVTAPRDWVGAGPNDQVRITLPPEACRILTE